MPFLGWGPLTHAYINRRALEFLDEMGGIKNPDAASALKNPGGEKLFLETAGYPDIIKAKGFLKGDMSYDYAHNPLPNRYYGQPEFAMMLFRGFASEKNAEGLAMALSWRAHQISDIFAHHAPLNGFWGYANSVNFFGLFWPDVLKHLNGREQGDLPRAFHRADHWITELIIDLYCYLRNGAEWGREMLCDSPSRFLPIVSQVGRDYLRENGQKLREEYEEIAPIETSQLKRGKEFCDSLNAATRRYFDSLIKKRTTQKLVEMIGRHGKFETLGASLDYVAWVTAQAIYEPDKPWRVPGIVGHLFLKGNVAPKDVFPSELAENERSGYFSEHIENEYKNYKPGRVGIVRLVLEKMPIPPVKWLVLHSSLVTGGNTINRILLPKGASSHAISLRYAFNIRESEEEDFMVILRRTLEEIGIIDIEA